MSKLDELLEKLCPAGVKYYYLGELEDKSYLKLGRGQIISKKDLTNFPGDYPVYSSSAVGDGEIGRYGKYMFDDERITWSIDGGGKFFYRNNLKYSVTNVGGWLKVVDKTIVNTKFLYYILINEWAKKKYNYTKKAHPSVIRKEYYIPMPPIEIQCEIVRILDNFTELSEQLSIELSNRKKQYEYYRSKLFRNVLLNMVELNEIGDVTKLAGFEFSEYVQYSDSGSIIALRGLNVKDGKLILDNVKYIDNSNFSKLDRSKLLKEDILYTYVGTVGQVGLVDCNDKYYLAPNVARIRVTNKEVLPRFVMYFLQTPEFKTEQLDKLAGSSSMKNITMANIRKFKIPQISLKEQERIVNILDKFDKLCNDISEGIPTEIQARKKQYEYYRNKLLTFKELKVNE